MSEEKAKRKLAAILSADVKGYSRLMEDDEETTVRTIKAYREIMVSQIQNQNGRVVDAKGDNLLAEFSSVVDAVRCAVKIQKEIGQRNAELPEHRKMEFRIGVNLGDVIEEVETIYGDGVNIAARLEGLAKGGEVCISGTAFDHVEGKLGLEFEYLGEQSVKNIKKAVRIYRVKMEGAVSDAKVRQEPPLPDRPSIAVLPFANMSDDPKQEFFSDGMTEEIITALSTIPQLFVVARNSSFVYKGKAVNVQQVSRELGVKYVLEGSVRKSGNRLRITAQLIDAMTGNHLWAERYDRELKDIFALQDEITMKIVTALQVKLTDGEQAREYEKGTNNLDAYSKVLESRYNWARLNREANIKARQLAEQAIALDPEYPEAYAALGWTHWLDLWLGWSESPGESMRQAFELAQKCVTLDESNANAYRLLSWLFVMKREHEKAIVQAEKAVTLHPNSADIRAGMGIVLYFADRLEEAILSLKKAIRINPIPPTGYLLFLGMAYRDLGRYEEAIAACKKALTQEPDNIFAQLALTATYSMQGQEDAALVAAEEVLRIDPDFSVEYFAKTRPHIDPANTARFADALRKAGLK